MIARATATVTVLRTSPSTLTDEYGDELDNSTVAATGIPVGIMEQIRRVFNPVDGTEQTVRYITGRASRQIDIRVDDRLQDERTGQIFMVEAVTQTQNPVLPQDTRLELRRVSTTPA